MSIIFILSISVSCFQYSIVFENGQGFLVSSSIMSSQTVSIDPNWNLDITGARKARAFGYTGRNATDPTDPIVIAVLDSGIYNHSEFRNSSGLATLKNSTDFTGEGTQDDTAHGTHVAGIIASNVRGIAPDVILYNFKVIGSGGTGDTDWLEYALNNLSTFHPPHLGGTEGVDIVTMSLGVIPDDWAGMTLGAKNRFINAVNSCLEVGMILLAAAGNYNTYPDGINYPAALQGVICVGAINRYEIITSYSEYGAAVDFVAPGGDATAGQIQSTFPAVNGTLGYMAGTSQATPHLAGIIAILLGMNSTIYNNNTIYQKLTERCKDLGTIGRDNYYGLGFPQLFVEDNYLFPFIVIIIITVIAGVVVVIIPGRKE